MARFNFFLSLLLVLCALALVTAQDRARRLFTDLERANATMARLEVQKDQLQIEQTALAKAARIDERARRELAMESVSPRRTLHLVADVSGWTVPPGPALARIGAAQETPRAASAIGSPARDPALKPAPERASERVPAPAGAVAPRDAGRRAGAQR
jgi:cell division protein FtsL